MFCHMCGSKLAADSSFCSNCGAMVAESELAQIKTPETTIYSTNEPYNNGQTYYEVPSEPAVSRKPSYKKIERFRIATGVVAIVFGAICAIGTVFGFEHYGSPVPSYAPLAAALFLCAVHAFAYYGKKQGRVFEIAMFLFAGAHLIRVLNIITSAVLSIPRYFYVLLYPQGIVLVMALLTAAVVFATALQYYKKSGHISKALPIVMVVLAAISLLIFFIMFIVIISNGDVFYELVNPVDIILYLPFLLFLFGCPPEHRRIPK